MISQVHQLLLELIPGGAKRDLSAAQAKALLAKVRPRDAAGKARRRVAAELHRGARTQRAAGPGPRAYGVGLRTHAVVLSWLLGRLVR